MKGKRIRKKMNTKGKYQFQGMLIFLGLAGLMLLTACQSNAGTGSEEGNASAAENRAEVEDTENLTDEFGQNDSDYLYEELEDGTLRITAYQPDSPLLTGATLEVPAEIDGKKVTVIGEECFADEEVFESGEVIISLPEGITTIEAHVLNRWVRKIEIPDSVTEIEEEAFFWLHTYNNYVRHKDGTLLRFSYQESEWEELNDIIICCSKDSLAERYARDRELRYIYPDDDWRKDEAFLEQQGIKDYQYFDQYRVDGTLTDFIVIDYYRTIENSYPEYYWVYDIVVLDKTSGEELQRIPLLDDWAGELTYRQGRIIEEGDADFDGTPELLVLRGRFGNQVAALYHCYHWEAAECRYIEYDSFRGIFNPSIDEEAQVIRGFSRGGANLHYEDVYEFRNGEFIRVEEKEVIFEGEGDEMKMLVETDYYQAADGNRTLTERTLSTYESIDGEWQLIKEEERPLD